MRVCGCVDGSWEADTVQESRPLATDLFGRWRFQSNSHPASQWPWPPNISITSSSTDLPQPVMQERGKDTHSHTTVWVCALCSSQKGWEKDRYRKVAQSPRHYQAAVPVGGFPAHSKSGVGMWTDHLTMVSNGYNVCGWTLVQLSSDTESKARRWE